MSDPIEDKAPSAEGVAEVTGEAEEQDETGAPKSLAETQNAVAIEASDQLETAAPEPFMPEEAPSPAAGRDARPVEPMYSSAEEATDTVNPRVEREREAAADREPRPGNATAPGQRPSESGSTPSDIPTEADEDAHRDHTLRRLPASSAHSCSCLVISPLA